MIQRIVVASKNADKISEVEAVLEGLGVVGELVRGLSWPDVDETGATLADNALLKARAVLAATGITALADDTGLEVVALGGAPGVNTARFAGPDASYADNVEKMLRVMEDVTDRRAQFRTVVALAEPSGMEWVAEGLVNGVITSERRGGSGFGYDPVFEVAGVTLAEMGAGEKNEISHRARALRALAALLSD